MDIVSGPLLTLRFKNTKSVCDGFDESVTTNFRRFPVGEVAAVGVPLRMPDEGSKLKPFGSKPAVMDQLNGMVPPVAVSVAE